MRRRTFTIAAASGLVASLAGCLGRSDALVDRTVRDWQAEVYRSFEVKAEVGQTIRVEFNEVHSTGAAFEIYRPDQWEGNKVFEAHGFVDRDPLDPVEYVVKEPGRHTVVVHPCCGGLQTQSYYAWIRIFVLD